MSRKGPGACHCRKLLTAACSNPITQEDLLCDDCRDGCNAVFLPLSVYPFDGNHAALGPHIRATIQGPGFTGMIEGGQE